MAENPSPPPLPGTSRPLRIIKPTAGGVGISVEFINSIIERIEDLVAIAQSQKPIAGNNVTANFTSDGAVINAVTQ
jgi:hypothetical protein